MSKANNYDVVLEKVGNQPLKTTKILCETLGLGLAKAKGMVDKVPTTIASDIDSAKALDLKKQLEAIGNTVSVPGLKVEEESSAPAKKAIYTDNDFDAIFGGGAAAKATPPVTRKSTTKTEPKATATPSSVKATPKAEKKKSASSNDSFDALFSGTTTGSSTAKKTSTTKTEPKKTTSKAPAASSDSFDSLFGGAAPKKETKTQPKASVAKTMRKEYSNGSYEGEMKDGEPHGFGTYRWNDGDVYTGEYVNGTRHGKGKFVFASGNYYDGEWADGKYQGHGIYHWNDGDEFDGEWKDGKRHGKGKWTYADGRYYTGVWENGESISSSSIVYPSTSNAKTATKTAPKATTTKGRIQYEHSYYEGDLVDGIQHGKGVYVWDDGTRYVGDFFEGNITGHGVSYYTNGDEYDGEWVKGKKCGHGVYKSYGKNDIKGGTFVSYIYEGEWKDGKKHGRGVAKGYKVFSYFGHVYMSWSYDGEWVADNKHGNGAYWEWGGDAANESWRVYRGEWVDNVRQGLFVWNYEPYGTGKKYINYYVDGKDVVWGAPYSPSIKTLEDAKRAKAAEDAKNGRTVKAPPIKKVSSPVSTKEEVLDCNNKAMQAYNNRDYFRCLYYMNRGGLSGDDFYRDVIGMCYHKGYAYVENILTAKSLKYISDEEINICAFVLDKFVPKGTKNSKTYRAWCYYRLGDVQKAAGMITTRGLMFYDGRIQDINEIMCGTPLSKITPYSDEIMACNLVCKVMSALDGKTNWVNYLRQHYKEKVLIADAYIKFAKKERWQYEVAEIEEDIITFKAAL